MTRATKHVLIIRVAGTDELCVILGATAVAFGRSHVYADVPLRDPVITKRHFDIDWNAREMCHEVIDYGRYSLKLNGQFLAGTWDRVPLQHPRSWKGDRRLLSPGDVLAIGRYELEYVALRG